MFAGLCTYSNILHKFAESMQRRKMEITVRFHIEHTHLLSLFLKLTIWILGNPRNILVPLVFGTPSGFAIGASGEERSTHFAAVLACSRGVVVHCDMDFLEGISSDEDHGGQNDGAEGAIVAVRHEPQADPPVPEEHRFRGRWGDKRDRCQLGARMAHGRYRKKSAT